MDRGRPGQASGDSERTGATKRVRRAGDLRPRRALILPFLCSCAMRPTPARFARILPRKDISPNARVLSLPSAKVPRAPTLMEDLLARQRALGPAWPANIRLEPVLDKSALEQLPAQHKAALKRLVKRER
jgi:hypothetical protein